MSADPRRLKDIFLAAAGLPPADRELYLDDACQNDSALRRRLLGLLAAHDESAGPLGPAPDPAETATQIEIERPGGQSGPAGMTLAGRYRLVELLGEGGMGSVWRADQTEPVRRRVAVKLIRPGLDSARVVARFESERQALAVMDHPNIAKVLDGGTAPDGRPFFVMELVDGLSVTRYCADHQLNVRQRLELFGRICQAVQHAHQKGVLHRDLKPSNVLVSEVDGRPMPKVIDFGLAKALSVQDACDPSMDTLAGSVLGTPLYMAPEQAGAATSDVDTRADVYALGVILYELLTGTTPVSRETARRTALAEVLRLVRESDPPTPTARRAQVRTAGGDVAVPPSDLRGPRLRELDWIVMKALAKERDRRYATAAGLGDDVGRFLRDEAVEAGPPTWTYRLRKFGRRYWVPLATASGFVALLAASAGVSAWLAVRAIDAEARAKRDRDRAVDLAQEADQSAQAQAISAVLAGQERDAATIARERMRVALYDAEVRLAKRAWDAGHASQARVLLARQRPGPGELDLRGFEFYYLNHLARADLLTIDRYANPWFRLDLNSDGSRLATMGGTLAVIWDARTGQQLRLLPTEFGIATGVVFRPGRSELAVSYGRGEVRVWDSESGRPIRTIATSTDRPRSLKYSPDGKRMAMAWGVTNISLWDADTGTELTTLHEQSHVSEIAFTPDGRYLVAAGWNGFAHVWDVEARRRLTQFPRARSMIRSVAVSPDGARVACGTDDGELRLSAMDGKQLVSVRAHVGTVAGVTFSPDSRRVATCSEDHLIKVWDVATGRQLLAMRGHEGRVRAIQFDPAGGELVSASEDKTIRFWNTDHPQEFRAAESGIPKGIVDLAFVPGKGPLATAGPHGSVDLRDSLTLEPVRALPAARASNIYKVRVTPDGSRLFAVGLVNWVTAWDLRTNGPPVAFQVGEGAVSCLATGPDGCLVTGLRDGGLEVWEPGAVRPRLTIPRNEVKAAEVAVTAQGRQILVATTTGVLKWFDARSGQFLRQSGDVRPQAGEMALSPDLRLLAIATTDRRQTKVDFGEVTIRDVESGADRATLRGHTLSVHALAFSPDGRRLATGSDDRTVRIWDTLSGSELLSLGEHPDRVLRAAFRDDGRVLATTSVDGTIRVWDATTQPRKRAPPHQKPVPANGPDRGPPPREVK